MTVPAAMRLHGFRYWFLQPVTGPCVARVLIVSRAGLAGEEGDDLPSRLRGSTRVYYMGSGGAV